MSKDELGIVIPKGIAVSVKTDKDFSMLVISKDKAFEEWITDCRMTTDNKTVGETNRDWLHKKLDSFINGVED